MADRDSRKRRARKRLTIELDEVDEPIVRRARVWAAKRGITLREYVIVAVGMRNVQETEAEQPREC